MFLFYNVYDDIVYSCHPPKLTGVIREGRRTDEPIRKKVKKKKIKFIACSTSNEEIFTWP